MRKNSIFNLLFFAVFFIFLTSTYSQQEEPMSALNIEQEPTVLKSEYSAALKDNRTKITIKSNVYNAAVFLNGQLEGNTTLTINDLPQGRYRLRVEKQGYEPKRYIINVRAGQEETFYIELKKYEGLVTFNATPEGSEIFVDGNQIETTTILLEEGEHTVSARCFGFTTQNQSIYVFRKTYQVVSFELTEAEFSVTDFKALRSSFNPSLNGSAGSIKFSFTVTNSSTGTIEIFDEANNSVGSFVLPEFTTWNQTVIWDGKDSRGLTVRDGSYTAVLKAAEKTLQTIFFVDSSIKLPIATTTFSGSGIGTLPQAFRFPKSTLNLEFSAGMALASGNDRFYAAPLYAAFNFTPLDFLEFSARTGLLSGYENNPASISVASKFAFRQKFSQFDFDWGFLLRAGRCGKNPWEPYGSDNGNGLGAGILLGIDTDLFYVGFSSEPVWYSTARTGKSNCDLVWRNGLALQAKTQFVALGIYGAINSSFGSSKKLKDTRTKNELIRAVESGIDLHINPFGGTVLFNIRGNTLIFSEKKYLRAELGLTIVNL